MFISVRFHTSVKLPSDHVVQNKNVEIWWWFLCSSFWLFTLFFKFDYPLSGLAQYRIFYIPCLFVFMVSSSSKGRHSLCFSLSLSFASSSILPTAPALLCASFPHLVSSVDLHLSSIMCFYTALKFNTTPLERVLSPWGCHSSNPTILMTIFKWHFSLTRIYFPQEFPIFIPQCSHVTFFRPLVTMAVPPETAPITPLNINLSFSFFLCSTFTWYYILCLFVYLITVCHRCKKANIMKVRTLSCLALELQCLV